MAMDQDADHDTTRRELEVPWEYLGLLLLGVCFDRDEASSQANVPEQTLRDQCGIVYFIFIGISGVGLLRIV
jgi:hypothetical protein